MIRFVNAKINIGLQIVRRRKDGYHDLQTVFYPVGVYAGTPENPVQFCDVLEISPSSDDGLRFMFTGREIDCPEEKNLVCRAAHLFWRIKGEALNSGLKCRGVTIRLHKTLPDGAGMGGGSADASFTLCALNSLLCEADRLDNERLAALALELGADCPFFIFNKPMYAEGVGERLMDIPLDFSGYWLLSVKPRVHVSTKEAFAGVVPKAGEVDLKCLPDIPVEQWQSVVKNDFEDSIFPRYPELRRIKEQLISAGAVYASMSGSGSSIYGIFRNKAVAEAAELCFKGEETIEGIYLLKL